MADVLQPLVVEDRRLAIPLASATQDGYLSRTDFILFSGGTVVPVTSFNTRTGEVILLEDDVLAALGYVPLDKHGGTMTGPLILPPGNPLTQYTAAHKAYVDSSIVAGGSFSPAKYFPQSWWLSDFKASGSATTYTGAITQGLKTLTLTSSTHDFAVGQGISIVGAGDLQAVGGNLLVSRITAVAGATITIADSAAHTVPGTAVVKHDDTVALQTAINAVVAAGGGTIIIDAGFYRLNGAFTDINSLIKLPFIKAYSPGAGPAVALALVGPPQSFPFFEHSPLSGVALFQTDRIGTNSNTSMMASALFADQQTLQSSKLTVYLNNLVFRVYDNPQISGLDFAMGGASTILENVVIGVTDDPLASSQPTHGGFGIRTPQQAVGTGGHSFDNLYSYGFGIGIWFSECFRSKWFVAARCMVGMQNYNSYHPAYGTGQISECPTMINITARIPLDMSLDFQVHNIDWYATPTGRDIYDPGNLATGVLKYTKMAEWEITVPHSVSNTGANRLTLVNLEGLGTRIAGPVTLPDGLNIQDLSVAGTLTLFDGSQQQSVTFGANNSATAAGFREVKVPNSTGGAGERSSLWAAGAGVEFAALSGSILTGLVSYWNCNDATGAGVLDSKGLNNLLDAGSVTTQVGHVPPSLLAHGYNGTTQYNAITNAGQTGLDPGSAPYTISCWVYLQSKAADQCLVSKSRPAISTPPDSYFLIYSQSSDRYQWVIHGVSTFHVLSLNTLGSPPLNTWTFLVVWFDGTTMYVQANNGPIDSLSLAGDTPNTSAGNFAIGVYSNSPLQNFLNGRIDAVGFWNRILSA